MSYKDFICELPVARCTNFRRFLATQIVHQRLDFWRINKAVGEESEASGSDDSLGNVSDADDLSKHSESSDSVDGKDVGSVKSVTKDPLKLGKSGEKSQAETPTKASSSGATVTLKKSAWNALKPLEPHGDRMSHTSSRGKNKKKAYEEKSKDA